jgi:hypothetical protein
LTIDARTLVLVTKFPALVAQKENSQMQKMVLLFVQLVQLVQPVQPVQPGNVRAFRLRRRLRMAGECCTFSCF